MQRIVLPAMLIVTLVATPAVIRAQGAPTDGAISSPPARPAGLTVAQFDSLRELETQPHHAAILDVHATYASDRERHLDFNRVSDDFWTAVYQAGFPGTIATMLIIAAPL